MASPRDTVVVAGALARRVGIGGHAWALVQWVLGLRELGYDVVFVDQLEAGAATDETGLPCPAPRSVEWRWMRSVLDGFGVRGSYALVADGTTLGMTRRDLGDARPGRDDAAPAA